MQRSVLLGIKQTIDQKIQRKLWVSGSLKAVGQLLRSPYLGKVFSRHTLETTFFPFGGSFLVTVFPHIVWQGTDIKI